MEVVLNTVVPVAAVVAAGFALAGRPGFDGATLANLALWITSPALLFSVLADTPFEAGRFAALVGGTLWVAAGTALLAGAWWAATGRGRGVVLTAVFFNGGNMGLACARLAFGAEGLEAAAVVFVTMALCTSLFGIWIAKGANGLGEALRHPLLWGSAGGLAVAVGEVEIPRMLMEPVSMLGAMAIPLMLLNLGMQLRALRVGDVGHSLAAVGIRMGGGLALAALFVALFAVRGVDRQVLLLVCAMPPAVINAVFAERYGTDPALVASAIVIGTAASLLVIPAVLVLVGA